MRSLLSDLRFAVRTIARTPGVSALIVLTLALGIGAASGIFSIVYPALFELPGLREPSRVVLLWERERAGTESNVGYLTFTDLQRETKSLESAAAMSYWQPIIRGGIEPERLDGQRVTARFFHVLGVQPLLGRDFTPEEDRNGANRVLILTYGLWQRRFAGDSGIIGRTVPLGDTPYTVVGVLPPDFESVLAPGSEVFGPLGYDASLPYACRSCRHLRVVARVRDGFTIASAERELSALMPAIIAQAPRDYDDNGVSLVPLHDYMTRMARPALLALVGAVGFVLLIACANAANLILGRTIRRESEFAVRTALGAGRRRLVRLILSESLVLALVAGALGAVLAVVGVRLFLRFQPAGIPRIEHIRVNGVVLAFTFLVAMLTGLAASLLPAIATARSDLHGLLKAGARGLSQGVRHRLRATLVITEVALAVTLLAGATLLFESLSRLLAVNAGFDMRNRLTMEVQVSGSKYSDNAVVQQFFHDAMDAVRAVPGVLAVGAASELPLGGNVDMYGVHSDVNPDPASERDPAALRYTMTADFLQAMGIPLLRGRTVTADEVRRSDRVVLINRAMGQRLYGSADPLGHRIHIGGPDSPWLTIVGEVGNVHHRGLDSGDELQMYLPFGQPYTDGGMSFVVKTAADPASFPAAVRRAIWSVDPNVAIEKVATMESLLAQSTSQRRLALTTFGVFALIALALAAAGIFGVLATSVAERTREIGVRTALGAPQSRILGMVVRQGLRLTTVGLVLGIGGAQAAGRLIERLLFGVRPHDPLVLLLVSAVLGVIAMVACAIPALRASRVDPVIALRDS